MVSIQKPYRDSKKFNDWCEYFLNKKNKKTYGNATQSALKAYNTKDYSSAGVIGHENLKKLKILGSMLAEQEGYGYARMIKIGIEKMEQSDDVKWWKEIMDVLGYKDQEEKVVLTHEVNIAEGIKKACIERNLPL